MMGKLLAEDRAVCFHCGDACSQDHVRFEDKDFCCHGCKSVFELLSSCDLEGYYTYAENPGIKTLKAPSLEAYGYLDDEGIQNKVLSFKSERLAKVVFKLPAMHCAGCIWLLENFKKLVPGVIDSRVNFVKRQALFSYDPQIVSLRHLAEQLAGIGYEPDLSLFDTAEKKPKKRSNRQVIQIGVAGFCFGNIMLLSFPEYLSAEGTLGNTYRSFFGFLNFALALPVLFYSASDYLRSALRAVRSRSINMDVPISLGIMAIFIRSTYEIFLQGGGGYMDSLAGLVFFLLVGKWFQKKTYDGLSFERDYKSYFPIAVQLLTEEGERSVGIENLNQGDRFRVRSGELIPADSVIMEGTGSIDYSFVSGESDPVRVVEGQQVFAGGRQTGTSIVVEAVKTVDQSYLTGLWNTTEKEGEEHELVSFADRVGKYFTYAVLFIAAAAGIFWLVYDPSLVLNAVSAVLIVACPCALALSFPFAHGNAIRLAGRRGLYFKNATALGRMAEVTHVVLDKTGTLTRGTDARITCKDFGMSDDDHSVLTAMAAQSGHPLSRMIHRYLGDSQDVIHLNDFREVKGAGLVSEVDRIEFRLGSREFSGLNDSIQSTGSSEVFFTKGGEVKAVFSIRKHYRKGLKKLITRLKKDFSLYLLSGDNDAERSRMEAIFEQKHGLFFDQLPHEKRSFIQKLKKEGAVTAMIGDGLNDASALRESDLGISVADDIFRFTPASDAILSSGGFSDLPGFFRYSRSVLNTVKYSFALSFLYNGIGLFFAVQGVLTPVIAAILMPISSISVVLFVTVGTGWSFRKIFKKRTDRLKTDKNQLSI